jgi:hypothetical protein
MSKAIYGHLGRADAALVAEVARLRRRVTELEVLLAAHEAELAALPEAPELVALRDTDLDVALRELGSAEPALT